MPKRIKLRTLTNEERIQLEKFSRSATESHRIVERANMILLAYQDVPVEQIANKLDRSVPVVYLRLKRIGEEGIAGLQDKPGKAREPTYSEAERGQMKALARTDPDKLGLPFGHWTLDRLVDYLHNNDQIGVSRAGRRLADFMAEETGNRLSHVTVSRILAANDIVLSRPQHKVNSPDPEYETKKRGSKTSGTI